MKKPFYGNRLIGILGFMYFCSSGVILPAANVINPLMLEDASMGLTGTLLGMGFSLFVLFQGLSAPVIGAVIDRIGARLTMAIGAVALLGASLPSPSWSRPPSRTSSASASSRAWER